MNNFSKYLEMVNETFGGKQPGWLKKANAEAKINQENSKKLTKKDEIDYAKLDTIEKYIKRNNLESDTIKKALEREADKAYRLNSKISPITMELVEKLLKKYPEANKEMKKWIKENYR